LRPFTLDSPPIAPILPSFSVLEPLPSQISLTSDGIRQRISFAPQKLNALLKPRIQRPPLAPLLSATAVRIKRPTKSDDFSEVVDHLFESVLCPPRLEEDADVRLADISVRVPFTAQWPVVSLPPVSRLHVESEDIINFEHGKLERGRAVPPFEADAVVSVGRPGRHPTSQHVGGCADLSLDSGDFVVVESNESDPVIRPLVGMASQLDIFVDDPDTVAHPFDPRIPLTRVSKGGLQPLVSPIPPGRPVLVLQSAVAAAAVHPHPSRPTDFVLTLGTRPTLHRFPRDTYLSIPAQAKVNIQNPGQNSAEKYLNDFARGADRSPESLCKLRSCYEGLRALARRGVTRTRRGVTRKAVKSAEIAGMIQAYHQILRSSPWARADQTMRDRLGLMHGSVVFLDSSARMLKRDRLKALAQQFENQLASIERGAQISLDEFDLIDFDEEEEAVEIADAEKEVEQEISPLALKKSRRVLEQIWEEEGLAALPKRKVLKQIEWSVVDGQARAEISWLRPPAGRLRSRRAR
jgi:hypothetical protein